MTRRQLSERADAHHAFQAGWCAKAGAHFLGIVCLAAGPLGAQNRKLNGDFQFVTGGDVLEAALAADGQLVVYLADQERDDAYELYRVPVQGGAPVKLNGLLPVGAEVVEFRISPDGTRAVYLADQDQLNVRGLYCVALDEAPRPHRLDRVPASFQLIESDYEFSPDSRSVVFRVDANSSRVVELFSVEADDGTLVQLNAPLVAGGDVRDFSVSADSAFVVYRADQNTDDVLELFSVPLHGGTPVRLNTTLVAGADVEDFALAPDGSLVVYRARQAPSSQAELYSVPIAGGVPSRVNETLVAGGSVEADFRITPDSRRVVYRADQRSDRLIELFATTLADGSVARLSGSIAAGGGVSLFAVAPDASAVVYRADQNAAGVHELFGVPLAGGTALRMNGTLPAGGDVETRFAITADSRRVVYTAEQDTDGVRELYAASLLRGGAIKLSGPLVAQGDVDPSQPFFLCPDSNRVVYRADAEVDQRLELYSVPIGGGSVTKLNGALADDGDVQPDILISADSKTVVYRAAEEESTVLELYGVSMAGGAARRKLNPTLAPRDQFGDVLRFELSLDGARCVYGADVEIGRTHELFSVSLRPGQPARTKLNPPLIPGGGVYLNFAITPDSRRVVYVASQESLIPELFSVPIEGGASVKLNLPHTGTFLFRHGGLDPFLISPDSSWVVYRADQETAGIAELFSVPVAGGPVVKISGVMTGGGEVYGASTFRAFWISPDSRRVVYVADQRTDGMLEVFSVPIEGGVATRLNIDLPPGSGRLLPTVRISPDSSRVAYVTSADATGELFSVPIEGGVSVKLNGPLVPFGRVVAIEISPDSAQVLYVASQEDVQIEELYSVPIRGGSATKLNDPLPPLGDVYEFGIDPSSQWVVYRARGQTAAIELRSVAITGGRTTKLSVPLDYVWSFQLDPAGRSVVYSSGRSVFEANLYSVPIGGGPSRNLKAPLIPLSATDGLGSFHISADSSRLVYLSWRGAPSTNELYGVELGGGPSVRINGPLVNSGDVAPRLATLHSQAVRLTADDHSVVYLADQDRDEVIELYQSLLPDTPGTPTAQDQP